MRSSMPSGRTEWARVVAAFEKSGLTQAEFCAIRGLNVGTFRSWLYRLRNEQGVVRGREESGPKLVELVALPERPEDSACVVRVGGTEVRFSVRPEVEYLGALLRAVEER